MEEVVGNFYVQGIEARRPEGGDRREGAAGNELSSALSEERRKREQSEIDKDGKKDRTRFKDVQPVLPVWPTGRTGPAVPKLV